MLAAAYARFLTAADSYGWVFGLHEALDQFGAMFGPLLIAAVLANRGSYHEAFAVLLVPAQLPLWPPYRFSPW